MGIKLEAAPLPATVVIPTVGRPGLLRNSLDSLARCEPRADDIVVVDQSGSSAVGQVVAQFADAGVRLCTDSGRGRGRAVNVGLRAACHDLVLVTDDDCTVEADWIGVAHALTSASLGYIITGRVLPVGDPRAVPSTVSAQRSRDYTGTRARGVLSGGNMAGSRRALLDFGGFDETIVPSAEDNDLCFRWLKAGRGLRYEPTLVVWHHDWRTRDQLRELYKGYARGDGVFYGKHLRAGELRALGYVLGDIQGAVRGLLASVVLPERRDWDHRLLVLPALLHGVAEGWRGVGRR